MDSDRYLNDFEERIESLIDEEGIFQICDDKKKPEILTSGKVNKGSNDSVHCDKDEIYSSPSNIHQSKNLVHSKDVLISNNESARFHETKKMPEKLIPGKSVLKGGTLTTKIETNNNSIIDVPPILRQVKGTNMSNEIYIKLLKSDKVLQLIQEYPKAFALLSLIALRANRSTDLNAEKLEIGEAFIGYKDLKGKRNCGITRQEYRFYLNTILIDFLTIKTTNKGTIAKLKDSTVYDLNHNFNNHQNNHQTTIKQPLTKEDIYPIESSSYTTPPPPPQTKKKEEFLQKKTGTTKIFSYREVNFNETQLKECLDVWKTEEEIKNIVDAITDWPDNAHAVTPKRVKKWRKQTPMADFRKENEFLAKEYGKSLEGDPGWDCRFYREGENQDDTGLLFECRGMGMVQPKFISCGERNFEELVKNFISLKNIKVRK